MSEHDSEGILKTIKLEKGKVGSLGSRSLHKVTWRNGGLQGMNKNVQCQERHGWDLG